MKSVQDMIKGKRWLAIAAAAAAGLILLSYRAVSHKTEKKEGNPGFYEVSYYTENLEERIAGLCRASGGVGEVSVFLTLESGSEYVYATNSDQKEGANGDYSGSREYLIVTADGSSSPVQVTEIYPKVRGVAVVCSGGDSPEIKKRLTELLSAALGIPSNRIRVSS